MRFIETKIAGAYIVELEEHRDARGFFARAWCADEFVAHGLNPAIAQINLSHNHRAGTLRGLHFQSAPHQEAKFGRCIRGELFLVIADVRPGSPSFRDWLGVTLSADNRRMVYVPEGCAQGYQALADGTELLYQASAAYSPGFEGGIRWNDPAFGIEWPLPPADLSEKDAAWPDFDESMLAAPAIEGARP